MRGQHRGTKRRRNNWIKRRTCKSKRTHRPKRKMNRRQQGGVISPKLRFFCIESYPDKPLPNVTSYKDFFLEEILMDRHKPGSNKDMAVATGYYKSDLTVRVAVKMCPAFHQNHYEILKYEACVYKNVTSLNWGNTVKYVFAAEINSTDLIRTSDFSSKFLVHYNQVYGIDARKPHKIFMLYTLMKPGTISLRDFFTKNKYSSSQLKSIIFQVVVTLCKLLSNNIQHNDLHASNILIDTNADGDINYQIHSTNSVDSFVVPINGCKILLFDWDLGFSSACKNNPQYTASILCPAYGVCPNFNLKFDLYTFMKSVNDYATTIYNDAEYKNF